MTVRGRRVPESSAPSLAPMRYESNGEAGDGQMICEGCRQETDDPHTWDVCAVYLLKLSDFQVDSMLTIERERDHCRARLVNLLSELPKCWRCKRPTLHHESDGYDGPWWSCPDCLYAKPPRLSGREQAIRTACEAVHYAEGAE